MNKEVWGNRLEFAGVLAVLLVTLWQAYVTDWWDEQFREWPLQTQESVNLSVLYTLSDLAALETETNPELRAKLVEKIRESTVRTVDDALSERSRREAAMKRGQAPWMYGVKGALVVLGAVLFLIGKWFALLTLKERAPTRSPSTDHSVDGS
jgi:hypothetical protein